MSHSVLLQISRTRWLGMAVLLGALVVGGFAIGTEPAWAASPHHIRHGTRSPHHRRSISRHHRRASRHGSLRHHRMISSKRSYRRSRRTVARRADVRHTYDASGTTLAEIPRRRFLALPPLYGSRESLLRQNRRADQEDLNRVENRQQLQELVSTGALVPIPVSQTLVVDPRLAPNRRYCRPWAASFLKDFSAAYYARFHAPIQVTSAVRTVAYQQRLLRINANAAPASGDTASPHLTGEAVDVGKKGLSPLEIGWIRAYLSRLQQEQKIDVEEEFYQACFHISVYRAYNHPSLPQPNLAAAHRRGSEQHHESSLLAAGLQ